MIFDKDADRTNLENVKDVLRDYLELNIEEFDEYSLRGLEMLKSALEAYIELVR